MARRRYRQQQALTLSDLVQWMDGCIGSGAEETEAEVDVAADATPAYVRVLTVHQAKGLEFPFVIVPFASRNLKASALRPEVLVHPERGFEVGVSAICAPDFDAVAGEEEHARLDEELRVLYVALTRAREGVFVLGTPKAGEGRDARRWSWYHEITEPRG